MSTNETRKIYILFTGQLRNTDLFNQSLAELFELKAEGIIEEIIFSTWRVICINLRSNIIIALLGTTII
jgi:hypothetical protein